MKKVFVPVILFFLTVLACSPPAEAPKAKKTLPRPENAALGVAIGAVPTDFEVTINEGDQLRLERKEIGGELWLRLDRPEIGGVNLVDLVNEWKATYEGRPNGKFFGQIELGTQFGPAYSVRGAYENEAGEMLEERRIFSVHPAGGKALTMVYTYPSPADSRARTDEMLLLFSELEALDFQPEASS